MIPIRTRAFDSMWLRQANNKKIDRPKIGFPVSSNDICSHIIKDNHMFIEFDNHPNVLTFKMVQEGQMYIDQYNQLCQKSRDEENEAWVIAGSDGIPRGATKYVTDDQEIKKILPGIKKITF